MELLTECPVCNSTRIVQWGKKDVITKKTPKNLHEVEKQLLLAKLGKLQFERSLNLCLSCLFLFMNPTYSEGELHRIYNTDGPKYQDFSKLIGKNPEDLWESEEVKKNFKKRQARYAKIINSYGGECILDYGGASGKNLLDPSLKNKQKYVYNFGYNNLEDKGLMSVVNLNVDITFDFILHTHVLEHEPDPAASLSKLHKLVKPGGLLYIEIPFEYCERLISRRPGAIWHVNYFNRYSLIYTAFRAGWSCELVSCASLWYGSDVIPCIFAILRSSVNPKPVKKTSLALFLFNDFISFFVLRILHKRIIPII